MRYFKGLLIVVSIFLLSACSFGGNTNGNYSIRFVTNGGKAIEDMTGLSNGDVVSLPTPVRDGYFFNGWYTDKECSAGSKVRTPNSYTYNGQVTLYAVWIAESYSVNIISNEVTLSKTRYTFETGADIVIPDPISDLYEFLGWILDGEPYVLDKMPGYDLTITANWQAKSCSVTFDLQGGVAPAGFISVINDIQAGSTITYPSPTKEGCLFIGWFDENNKKYTSSTPIISSLTLYAHYDDIANYETEYAINYVLDGGTLPSGAPTVYEVGVETLLPTPYKDDATFLGWYESSIFFGEALTSISTSTIGEVTIYAKWKELKDQYTVTYIYANGTSESVNVASGAKATNKALSNLSGEGLSWYLGRDIYDFNTPVYEDLTLHAGWTFLETMITTLIPEVFYDNENLPTSIQASGKTVSISWTSSDPTTIKTNGVTNPLREDAIIILTAKFTYNGNSINQEYPVIVPKVVFRDLSTYQPVFAYVYSGSYKGFTDMALNTIDVVNLAFARVTADSTVDLRDVQSNIEKIVQFRKQGIRVVLSFAGNLSNFSDTAYTSETRKKFAEDILRVINLYHLDGVDIDWEYPGYDTGRDVSVDRPNFTLMMASIDKAVKGANPDYLITAAVPGGRWGIDRYQVTELSKHMDYFHLMTYDFHTDTAAYHHCALYSTTNTSLGSSADYSVKAYHDAGAPYSKLVVGAAFYGRVYVLSGPATTPTGIGSTNVISSGNYITYTSIYNDYLLHRSSTILYYHDTEAQAGYIYSKNENKVIVFDDPASVTAKYNYAVNKGLGGLMYWENGEDTTDSLLKAINGVMNKS